MISYRGEIIESKEKAKENKSFLLYHLPQPEKREEKFGKCLVRVRVDLPVLSSLSVPDYIGDSLR